MSSRPDGAHPTSARIARLLPAALALLVRLSVGPLTVDDAYITFRYARNIAEGAGFVYNPGQPVLGTTTPLYALLLALGYRIGLTDLPQVAWLLASVLDAFTAILLVLIGTRLAGRTAGLIAGTLFALSPMSIAYAAGGMESSLFIAVLVGGLYATLRGWWSLAALLAASAALIRPEGILPVGLVLGARLLQQRRVPWQELAIVAAVGLPWALFARWYFGSPLPQTMSAKSIVYQTEPLTNAVGLLMHAILPAQSIFLLTTDDLLTARLIAAVSAVPILLALAISGVRRWQWAEPSAAFWLLFPSLYVAAYALAGLRGVRMFHWYLIPLVPFYVLVLAVGTQHLAERFRTHRRTASVLFGLLLMAWWLPGILGSGRLGYPVGFSLAREQLYRQVAQDYAGVWGAGIVIAAPEIGTLGYHVRGAILDTVGLVSPIAAQYYPLPAELLASDNAIAPRLIHEVRPDYVVSLDQFMRKSLGPDPDFQREYQLVEARPSTIWESSQILIYRRVDARPPGA
jgi:hypothetical protein